MSLAKTPALALECEDLASLLRQLILPSPRFARTLSRPSPFQY